MASIDEEKLRLTRGDPAPWGFRIQGGRDFGQPVTVCRVVARSIAEHAGLRVGDVIAAVGDKRLAGATHQTALDTIREASNDLLLSVIRGPLQMPEPFPEDIPLIQPPLAHEAAPAPPGFPLNRRDSEGVWGLGGLGPVLGRGPGADGDNEFAQEDNTIPQVEATEINEESHHADEEPSEDESSQDEEPNADESECSHSKGSQSLTERLLEQLHRVERNRASKPQPPTTFLLAPDRPPIRKPRQRPPPPPEPPFHKLVRERMRRRKWLEEHPGEEYPYGDPDAVASGRTPTPDGASFTYTRSPTPSHGLDTVAASDVMDSENVDELSHDGMEQAHQADETDSNATQEEELEPETPVAQSPLRSPTPSPPPTPLTIEETERRLQEVTAQLEALPRLPKDLQSELQHLRENLHVIVSRLQEQLDNLRRKQAEEERLREEEEECRRKEEEERRRIEEEERSRKEREEEERRKKEEDQTVTFTFHTPSGSRPSSAMSSRPTSSFKGPLPDFIHEMTEKLAQERPSFPLTPLPRPIVLPGGRKWRNSRDAFNEEFIAETLTSQAEVLLGHTLGRQLRKDSIRFPALLGLRCDLSVRCCCCGRVNFHKYAGKLEHLQNSAVYRAVHGLDRPTSPIAERPALVPALDDCCLAAQMKGTCKPKQASN